MLDLDHVMEPNQVDKFTLKIKNLEMLLSNRQSSLAQILKPLLVWLIQL
jgi:hypothetical protein